ncbi:MAG: SMI1/KNR4 family protein [Planctomycetes bacterium]|nr:SMI1/KNR4 family protein [Planctomycetota bacterium]
MIFHADTPVSDLSVALFATADESVASDAIFRLSVKAKKGDAEALAVLARYAENGSLPGRRAYACYYLVHSVGKGSHSITDLFRRGLVDPAIRFFCIPGYLQSVGKEAYVELVGIAEDATVPIEHRAYAIRCLSRFSEQSFDRNLPEPSRWREADLRLTELRAWADAGYPDGAPPPIVRHPALDQPTTAFERTVCRLDQKLKKRQKPRNKPRCWLAPGSAGDLERIAARWKLPDVYRDFLTRFTPVQVLLPARRLPYGVHVFGAHELIECQSGYACSPIDETPLSDWPAHLLVIASHNGDPFVLDLARVANGDAPVLVGERGKDAWKFRRVATSFAEFLEELAR